MTVQPLRKIVTFTTYDNEDVQAQTREEFTSDIDFAEWVWHLAPSKEAAIARHHEVLRLWEVAPFDYFDHYLGRCIHEAPEVEPAMPDMSKMALRPSYMAPKDGTEQWFVRIGCFCVKASWDSEYEAWMPSDRDTQLAIRRGTCEFVPDYWLAHVEKPEDTIWSGRAWLTREEIDG